jgi:hypothetical protein
MKFRNSWNATAKQWDKLIIRLRISSLDIFALEVDLSRDFYLITILNLTLKNR